MFPLAQHYFTHPGTHASCPWVQPEQPDLFPVQGWGERRPPQGMRWRELPAPRRGNEPGNYRKRSIQQEASLAPAWLRACFGPPLPGASRPWVGNPARCGKRSRDGGCQATLIQPLTNFQHFASAAEPNQQMIKHQVHLKPMVSIHLSITEACSWPCAWVPPRPQQHP